MARIGMAVVAAALAACGDSRAPPVPYPVRRATMDAGSTDGGLSACAAPDAAACAPTIVTPPAMPAAFVPDGLDEPRCMRFDEPAPFEPSIFALDGALYLFDVDAAGDVPQLRFRRGAVSDLAFGKPVTLLYGARRADLIAEAGKLVLLAARQYYAVVLESEDGIEWSELQNVGPDEPTYLCDGFAPPVFFRGRTPARFLAMGNDYHDGIFGCHDRVFLARRDADVWETPTQIGEGDVLFALDGEARLVVLTTLGALVSDDDGKTFVREAGVNGSGAAWTGKRLLLARVHDGATTGGIAVAFSDDEAESWWATVLYEGPPWSAPLAAGDGATVAVAWEITDAMMLTRSNDEGETWSEPRVLPHPAEDRLASLAVSGDSVVWLTVGNRYEVCVVE